MKNKIYITILLFLYLFVNQIGYAQQPEQVPSAPVVDNASNPAISDKQAAVPPASLATLRKRNELSLLIGAGGGSTYTYGGVWLQKTALVLFVEPQYSLSPRLNLGLRLEGIMPSTYRATYRTTGNQYNLVNASAMYSVALMLDYSFATSTATYAPFMGVGIGNYFRGKGDLISDPIPQTVDLGVSSGIIVRAGVSSKHLTVSAEINMLNENKTNGNHVTWWGGSGEFRGRSYVSLKAGFPLVLLSHK